MDNNDLLTISNSRLEAFAQLVTLLIIFVFVLALTYFSTKWIGNFQKNKLAGNNIEILETMKLSNSKYIQIVRISTKVFTIAVCKDTITYLGDLNEEDLVFKNTSTELKSENFKAILEKFKKDKPED